MIKHLQQVKDDAVCLYTHSQIQTALDEMATAITAELATQNPLCLCVMNGGVITTGHLITRLDFPLQLDYIHASRYGDKTQGGQLQWHKKPSHDLAGRVVLLIDDILDEGLTLRALILYCQTQKVKKIYTTVLLDKDRPRAEKGLSHADFTGRKVANEYVFGYGLDYKGYWRNADGIYAIKTQTD